MDEEAIVNLYKSGEATYDIVKRFNSSRWIITKILKSHGVQLIRTRSRIGANISRRQ